MQLVSRITFEFHVIILFLECIQKKILSCYLTKDLSLQTKKQLICFVILMSRKLRNAAVVRVAL
jgi:hypothetical protein